MSDATRHAEFLARRLRALGVAVEHEAGASWLRGSLELSAAPFETLAMPLRAERALFYSLGHGRLKFFEPRVFFDLPALEIGGCETRADIERALRRAWQAAQRDLAAARAWLERISADASVARQGTRLRLLPGSGSRAKCEVRSPDEVQVPSAGPLADTSAAQAADRRYRPLRGLASAGELDLALAAAAADCARRGAGRARGAPPPAGPEPVKTRACVLALTGDAELARQLAREIPRRGFAVESFADPERALAAFHLRSFDAVLVEARVGRADGLEIALRVREIPGVEDLPVALIDARDSAANRATAGEIGSLRYALKPLRDDALGELLADLIDHITRRRFRRFAARLSIRAAGAGVEDRTEQIARGGVCLRTARDLQLGQRESYALALPAPHEPLRVHGLVVSRAHVPGSATSLAGVRFTGFDGTGEARWIDVIEALAGRENDP